MANLLQQYTINLEDEIGRGTFGSVYTAINKKTKVAVAVKKQILSQGGRLIRERCEMASKEFQILQDLQEHQNIVRLIGQHEDARSLMIFMELCDCDLPTFMAKGNCDMKKKLRIMYQCSDAINFMHTRDPKIAHRDIKPTNVLMKIDGDDAMVKISDFGMGKILSDVGKGELMSTFGGSYYYFSPEFFTHIEDHVELKYTLAVDTFALGLLFQSVLLYSKGNAEMIPKIAKGGPDIPVAKIMFQNHKEGKDQPKLFDLDVQDRKGLKQIITEMCSYRACERPPLNVVKDKLWTLIDTYKYEQQKNDHQEKSSTGTNMEKMQTRYEASMVLSGVGDALGYKNGSWEFCHSGADIREELNKLGGLSKLKVDKKDFMVSDDTVLHLATAEALIRVENTGGKGTGSLPKLYNLLEEEYRKSMKDMIGRAPGACTTNSLHQLKLDPKRGYKTIPFNSRAGGCGAAIRSMCIGLRYPRLEELEHLIAVSVESGRMTHNHPTGYLGSFAGALFTSYAIEGKPPREWGHGLVKTLAQVQEYVKKEGRDVKENLDNWDYFERRWKEYLEDRKMINEAADPVFPEKYGVLERDAYYKSLSFSGWGGSSGHDAPMIAYDALLGAGKSFEELCYRSMFHSGKSDATGAMAAAWFGAMHGYEGVPVNLYKDLEYRDRLEKVANTLHTLAVSISSEKTSNPNNSAKPQGNNTTDKGLIKSQTTKTIIKV